AANGSYTYMPAANFNGVDSVDYTLTDGTLSDIGTLTITVAAVNDAPILDLDANNTTASGNNFATTFTEGGSAVYLADTDISITDVDSTTISTATITITNKEGGDFLTVGTLPSGITASAYNSTTGVITLSGTASLSDYQSAIRAIQYSNDGSTVNTTRAITVVVNDGANNSALVTANITIVTLPTVSITDVSVQEPASGTATLTFTISIDQPLATNLTFNYATANVSALSGLDYVAKTTTVGTIIAGATSTTVTVTVNSDTNLFEGDETFNLNLTGFNQTVNFEPGAHVISGGIQGIGTIGANNGAPIAVDDVFVTTPNTPLVTGNVLSNDTLVDNAHVQTYSAISVNGGTVVYNNDGTFTYTPANGYTGTDTFTYTLIDDDGDMDTATVTVNVNSIVVVPPAVSNVPDTTYVENGTPINLVSGVTISDTDSTTLSSVVITVNGYIASQDVIDYLTAGTSITATTSVSGNTWTLTLSGGVDINEYQSVMGTIMYHNTSENPSTSTRNVTVTAYDQSYANLYGSDAGTLNITAVNDAAITTNNEVYTIGTSQDNLLHITLPTDADTDTNLLVITVTGLPINGTVTLEDGTTPVTNGEILTLAQLGSLKFDAGALNSTGTLTYTVSDGQYTSTGTTTINVGTTKADVNTVYESGLNIDTPLVDYIGTQAGIAATVATGNLFANDAGTIGQTLSNITVGGTAPIGGIITTTTSIGTLQVYTDSSHVGYVAGDYVYTLTSPYNNPSDPLVQNASSFNEVFNYQVTANGIPLSNTLTINVVDDTPIANPVVQDVPESEEKIFNIVLTLDKSGSMAWGAITGATNPGTEPTRMEIAQSAIRSLVQEYFNQSTNVTVTLLTFSTNAAYEGTYTDYNSFATKLATVTPNGGTNYVGATNAIVNQFTADLALPDAANKQQISYFISDGEATAGTSPIGSGYIEYVNSHSIESYSVGIGSSLPADVSDLNYIHNIDSMGSGTIDSALIVDNLNNLQSVLLSTVPTAYGGNITANGSIDNVLFGADGGYVKSITLTIGGVTNTITYDGTLVDVPTYPTDPAGFASGSVSVTGSNITIIQSDTNFIYGTFTFDFNDGSYTFSAPNGTAPLVFEFAYTIIDRDGDMKSSTATINIVDDSPDARDDLHTITTYEIAEGNVISAIGTDGGPKFGNNITPFAVQGGGVDKIVDNATVSKFNYKGAVIDLTLTATTTVNSGTPVAVPTISAANVTASGFTLIGSNTVNYNTGGAGIRGGNSNTTLDTNENITVNFAQKQPLGVSNVSLVLNDFLANNTVSITVKDISGAIIAGPTNYSGMAGGSATITLNQTGIGSVEIVGVNAAGDDDAQLGSVAYTPLVETTTLSQTSGTNGSNLDWTYSADKDLDGKNVFTATVTDSSDGSTFIMRSNGYYNYIPDQSNKPVPVVVHESFTDGNVNNGVSLSSPDATPGLNTTYGITMNSNFDASTRRLDSGEEVTLSFSSALYPDGVKDISLTNYYASGSATITVYDVNGAVLDSYVASITTNMTINTQTIGIGSIKIDTFTSSNDQISITAIDFTKVPDPVLYPSVLEPILVDYTLTDTDGQFDTAQLAIYTPDQTLTGTAGVDNISGGILNDAIIGDAGDDTLSGNDGHDTLSGGIGNDTLSGGTGIDHLSGGDGNDALYGGADADSLSGDAGDDLLDGGTGDDIVKGGIGNDALYGGAGNDRLEGDSGNDILNGGAGADVLMGGDGEDILTFDASDTLIDGGKGFDTLLMPFGGNIDFNLLNTANNTIKNMEVIDLSANGSHSLTNISLQDVIDMTDGNKDLYILGDVGDTVTVDSTLTNTGTSTEIVNGASHVFDIYTNSGDPTVTLKIEQVITDTI
ncbi:MAG: Ig-like domain-containing protein, partial [Pseudomonadota bacterium]